MKGKKAMSKKEIETMKNDLDQAQAKVEKEIADFQKRAGAFGKDLEKICSKHGFMVLMQGFDKKSSTPFIMGYDIKSDFESRAMESYFFDSISRNKR